MRHILSDGSLDDELYNGRITASKAMLLCDAVDTALPKKVLLSGPAKMKENVLRGLDLAGFPVQDIRYEDFHHPPHLDAPCFLNARFLPNMPASPFASPTTPIRSP